MEDGAARFAERFASFWAKPDLDDLGAILTDDVRLVQPLSRTTVGLAAARESFRRLFREFPDLRGEVDRWRGGGDCLFIEFRLRASIGSRPFEWPAVDRFTLRADKACERVSYFDGIPLAMALAWRPLTALRLLRR
jgi:ketosteroid isomerase-like protein